MTNSETTRSASQTGSIVDDQDGGRVQSPAPANAASGPEDYATLTVGDTSLILACAAGTCPRILYWGTALTDTRPEDLELMTRRQHAKGGPDVEIAASLLNEPGLGLGGASGFAAHRGGKEWASVFLVERVERPAPNQLNLVCRDRATQICVTHLIGIDPRSEVMTCRTRVGNEGEEVLSLDWCTALCLPLDERASCLRGFSGRWASEFQIEHIPEFSGAYVRENKTGRTSHDSFPGLIATDRNTNEDAGMVFGYHLGWSGNSRVRVDRLSDGRAFVQMGEYFFPGEMRLAPGEVYQTPVLFAAAASKGLNSLSQKFHTHFRKQVMDGRIRGKARPVHYNTWEAVYFNHDEATLFSLAEAAAQVGAERFVLDDGWFGGRRHDKAGLGDWWVSKDVYPDGLGPLIRHVGSLGMEFGIWVEPEMVNPDSDLYRAHPDWVLGVDAVTQVPFRGQYVLDLTRSEVVDYLFAALDGLLGAHDISYLKWDMNRDVHHPASGGRAVMSRQISALYRLLERLRAAHPKLEIETCASGGGRADYGILSYADRIWVSDSNDAVDRQRIQCGASHFFPLEVTGSHVGPKTCHSTGRKLSMEMRVASAMFGHMGMELNLLQETKADLEVLKAGIVLYKAHRELLHTGLFWRLDTPDHINAMGVVSLDRKQALFSWANLTGHGKTLPGRIFFPGLSPERRYRTQIIWPSPARSPTSPSIIEAADLSGAGTVFSGEALMRSGLQVPLMNPETCLIYRLIEE